MWVRDSAKQNQLQGCRRVTKLSHVGGDGVRRSVYCEALYADDDYISRFPKQPALLPWPDRLCFINKWYRDRLRITDPPGKQINLKIGFRRWSPALLWLILACMEHPQLVVPLATWLGLVGLGVVGVGFALLPLGDVACLPASLQTTIRCGGWCFVLFGLVEILWSTRLVHKRNLAG